MKYLFSLLIIVLCLLSSCSKEEASELERTKSEFLNNLGANGTISPQQWWRTSVTLRINVTTEGPVKLWLLSQQNNLTQLCDYKELSRSGSVTMTGPQGKGTILYLAYEYNNEKSIKEIELTGKQEEYVILDTSVAKKAPKKLNRDVPASLSGRSKRGNAEYYEFTSEQMADYFDIMEISMSNADAKVMGLNCNYELSSEGPFKITWVNGFEADQRSHILGYYYHSADSWDDIKYVDLSETHKWDYIDGLAKVQYQFSEDVERDGHLFKANTWYDANFDCYDIYGSTRSNNPDRLGDDAYNSQDIFSYYEDIVSGIRGISFEIDVPEGMHIGFYLRSDEELEPDQYDQLVALGVKPNAFLPNLFKGTCFCAEELNIVGNGRGLHRSFVHQTTGGHVIWMGMEDLVNGGDHDCNDLIFGVVSKLEIHMPKIVDPTPTKKQDNPNDPDDPNNPDNPNNPDDPNNPDNPNNPDDPNNPNNPDDPNNPNNPDDPNNPNNPGQPDLSSLDDPNPLVWTIAYEDVGRDPDFDFNDAVIKLIPDFENERCCIQVMAAGSTQRMYLHFDGPEGDQNMGEIHDLLGSSMTYVNTKGALASTPFVTIDCVPWPKGYTMGNDAKRFYIEIQRGTCDDCTDVITLAMEPGQLPEALLVAGEWQWPMEGVSVYSAYNEFGEWAQDVTRTRFWEWYRNPEDDKYVEY